MLHIALQNLEFFHHYKKRDKYKQRETDNKKIVHVSIVKCSQVQNEQKTFALVRETTPRYSILFFGASAMQATCHNSLNRVRFSTSVMTWKKQNKTKKHPNPTAKYSPFLYEIKASIFEYYIFKRTYLDFSMANATSEMSSCLFL